METTSVIRPLYRKLAADWIARKCKILLVIADERVDDIETALNKTMRSQEKSIPLQGLGYTPTAHQTAPLNKHKKPGNHMYVSSLTKFRSEQAVISE